MQGLYYNKTTPKTLEQRSAFASLHSALNSFYRPLTECEGDSAGLVVFGDDIGGLGDLDAVLDVGDTGGIEGITYSGET